MSLSFQDSSHPPHTDYSYYIRITYRWWDGHKTFLYSELSCLYRIVFLGTSAFYKSWISLTKVGLSVKELAPTLFKHLRLKLPVDSHFQNLTFEVISYALAQETNSCNNGWVLLIIITQQIFVEYVVYVKLYSKPWEYLRERNKILVLVT